jgi:hypothetical protein
MIVPSKSDKFLVGFTAKFAASGLIPRGIATHEGQSVLLIGHAGSSIWPHFTAWLAKQSPLPENSLDTWSREIITAAAAEIGGHAVFPSDEPYLPFQQWAIEAEGLSPSPLGILIHPVYGLWHAYRGAILLADSALSAPSEKLSHPCDTCVEKPCLRTCPVNAFSDDGYDVAGCRSHLKTEAGQTCMTGGCLARLACPIGREFTYVPWQMQFHMAAFAPQNASNLERSSTIF